MNEESPGFEKRAIRIVVEDGAIEGFLRVGSRLRTLDELNLVAKRFVTVHEPRAVGGDWDVKSGPMSVNKNSILFVQELSDPAPTGAKRQGVFSRAPIRLRIKSFEVEGFVHVPRGGDVMKRIDQGSHAFVSLTSVLISGPHEDASAPFLAVNRNFITAAQATDLDEVPMPASVEVDIAAT